MREQYNQSAISPINASMRTDAQYGMNNIYDPSQIAKPDESKRYVPNRDYWSQSNITKSSSNLVGKNWLANPFAPNPDAIGCIGKTTVEKVNEFGEKIEVPIRRTEIAWA